MKSNFTPLPLQEIDSMSALRVLSQPLRLQIMEHLAVESLTVKELAQRMGADFSRLYYHINLLEKNGFVRMVATQQIGNLTEKFYRASAMQFKLAENLLQQADPQGIQATQGALAIIETTRRELQAISKTRSNNKTAIMPKGLILRERLFMTVEQAQALKAQLKEILDNLIAQQDNDQRQPNEIPFSLTVAFYETPGTENDPESSSE